jgi:hypothetical protein
VNGLKHQKEKRSMDHFAGLDVSVKETGVCIVDDTGRIVREVKVASEPEGLLAVLESPAYRFKRIGLEAGPLSQWLYSALAEAGLPVICVETRHMRAVLKAQINKTDRNDARGMAQMMRVGLYRPVHVKTLRSQKLRMLLTHRKLLPFAVIPVDSNSKGLVASRNGPSPGELAMFRFTPHRLSGIIAFSIAGLVMFCVHDARTGDSIAVEAHAEEMAPLAAINELVKHRGQEFAPESRLCDEFALGGPIDRKELPEEFTKDFTVVGATVDRDDLAKVDPKYPKDYDASFVTLVDRRPPSTDPVSDLVMRTTSVILCRTSRQNIPGYAFSVRVDGQILEAAVGDQVGNAYRWSVVARDVGVIELGAERPNEMTAAMQDIFSTELQLWSGTAMRHFVEDLPNKR